MTTNGATIPQVKAMLTEMAAESAELKAAVGGALTEVFADWLVPQYALAVRGQLAALPDGPERLKLLRLASIDLVAFQRGKHNADRLVLERERLAVERARIKRNQNAEFWKWTKKPEIRRKLYPPGRGGISKTTIRKIERELNLL
jgi:hypothetical protein